MKRLKLNIQLFADSESINMGTLSLEAVLNAQNFHKETRKIEQDLEAVGNVAITTTSKLGNISTNKSAGLRQLRKEYNNVTDAIKKMESAAVKVINDKGFAGGLGKLTSTGKSNIEKALLSWEKLKQQKSFGGGKGDITTTRADVISATKILSTLEKSLTDELARESKEIDSNSDKQLKAHTRRMKQMLDEISKIQELNSAEQERQSILQRFKTIGNSGLANNFFQKAYADSIAQVTDEKVKESLETRIVNAQLAEEEQKVMKQITARKKLAQIIEQNSTAYGRFKTIIQGVNAVQDKVSSGFTKFVNGLKSRAVTIRIIGGVVRQVWSQLAGMFEEAASYVESVNLYTIALGEYAEQGTKWANKISTALYLDPKDIMQYTGAFYNLVEGLGVASDKAYTMATNLTQLTYDMSSYLNIDVESAQAKIQSAITGQSRAVASAGIAMQQATLQELAYSMGIKKAVGEMTQAEKTYLRYIQIMRSTANMQGDLARTIITPENAVRVLKNQFTLLARAIGNIFIPIIMKAIPYIMALTKILQDLATRIASFLGVKIGWSSSEIDYSGLKLADTYLEDVGNTATGTSNKVGKAVKKIEDELGNLASFDQLNVITFNDDTSTGSGRTGGVGGVGGGSILPRLEEEISGYDMLQNLTSQFDKQVKNATENLGKFKKILEGVIAAFVVWKGLRLAGNLIKLVDQIKNGSVAMGGLGSVVSLLWNTFHKGTPVMQEVRKQLSKAAEEAGVNTSKAMVNMDKYTKGTAAAKKGTVAWTTEQVNSMSALSKFGVIAGGIAVTLASVALEYKNVSKQTRDYLETGKEMSALVPTLGVAGGAAGGAAVGTIIAPGIGTVIGAIVGGAASMASAWKSAKEEINKYNVELQLFGNLSVSAEQWTDTFNRILDSSVRFNNSIESLNTSIITHGEAAQSALDQLDLLSYKFSITGAKISGEDSEKILSALTTITSETTAQIEDSTNKDLLLWKQAFKYGRTMSQDAQDKMLSDIVEYGDKRKKQVNDINDKITQIVNTGMKSRGYLTKNEQKQIADMVEQIRSLLKQNMSNAEADMDYYKRHFRDKSNMLDKESYKTYMQSYNEFKTEQEKAIQDHYTQLLNSAEVYRQEELKSGKKTAQEVEKEFNQRVLEADSYRKRATEEMNRQLDANKTEVLSTIGEAYVQLINKTDEASLKTRGTIEGIFSELNLNPKEMLDKFGNIGTSVGQKTAYNIKQAWENGKPAGYFLVGADTTGFANTVNKTMTELQTKNKNLKMTYTPIQGSKTTLSMNNSKLFAEGGYPDSGDLFFANENGVPEYITSIGNKSAVVNQQQMVTALTNAIVEGLSNMNTPQSNEPVNIYIGNDKVYSGFINYAKRQNNIYGTNVIRV